MLIYQEDLSINANNQQNVSSHCDPQKFNLCKKILERVLVIIFNVFNFYSSLTDKKLGKSFKANNFNYNQNDYNDDDIFSLGQGIKKINTIDSNLLNKSKSSNGTTSSDSKSVTPSHSNNSLNLMNPPDTLITSPSSISGKHTSYFNGVSINSSGSSTNSSRARLAQENLQRLEREKDDLYEL